MDHLTSTFHISRDTRTPVKVGDLARDAHPQAIYVELGDITNIALMGDLEDIERILDDALLQVVRLKAARQAVPLPPLVEIHELKVGDVISFDDGEHWHRVDRISAHAIDWSYRLAGEGLNAEQWHDHKSVVRRRPVGVHAIEARVAS